MRKTDKDDNSVMGLDNFTKSLSGCLHLRYNLRIKNHDPSLSGSLDILFTSFHWFIIRKPEKGDNSVMGFENFNKK